MKSVVQEWLTLARQDLKSAERLLNVDDLANVVLFHSQQCVEKTLKACLEQCEINPPKIHNIQKLYSQVIELTGLDSFMSLNDIDFLDSVYIDARYPSGFGILPAGFPSIADAQDGIRIAQKVYDFIVTRINNIIILSSE